MIPDVAGYSWIIDEERAGEIIKRRVDAAMKDAESIYVQQTVYELAYSRLIRLPGRITDERS